MKYKLLHKLWPGIPLPPAVQFRIAGLSPLAYAGVGWYGIKVGLYCGKENA